MPLSSLWDFPSPFTLQRRVAAPDIDELEHTNNTVYVKWCEAAAWAHSASVDLDMAAYRRLDRAMAITRSEFDYLQASRLGDELSIATWITGWDGRLTMHRRFQVIRHSDSATLLRARMTFVCIEISSGRPRRMPAAFIDGYAPAVLNVDGDVDVDGG
ncbi:MAG: acyl-CoA thioesterase [Chromatocurvus sp.]